MYSTRVTGVHIVDTCAPSNDPIKTNESTNNKLAFVQRLVKCSSSSNELDLFDIKTSPDVVKTIKCSGSTSATVDVISSESDSTSESDENEGIVINKTPTKERTQPVYNTYKQLRLDDLLKQYPLLH